MIVEPRVWVRAKFTLLNDFDLEVEVTEASEKGPAPPTLLFLGAAMRSLHYAMGGGDRSGNLVTASEPVLFAVPGGTVQRVVISPNTQDKDRAVAVYKDAFARIKEACERLTGQYGTISEEEGSLDVRYGPKAVTPVREVNLAVTMSASGGLKPSF